MKLNLIVATIKTEIRCFLYYIAHPKVKQAYKDLAEEDKELSKEFMKLCIKTLGSIDD